MSSRNHVKNSYKGLLYNFILDLKKSAFVGIIIALSISVFDIILALIFITLKVPSSNDGSGSLAVGSVIIMISFIAHISVTTTNEGMNGKFTFPISRTIYAVSNFIFMFIGSFILLMIITIAAPIEVLVFRFIELVSNKFIFVNTVTLNSYLIGFLATWSYLVFFGSVTYFLLMYLKKYTFYALPVLTILIINIFLFGWFGEIFSFIFLEDELSMLIIKLIIMATILHTLAFIPLKQLEVQ